MTLCKDLIDEAIAELHGYGSTQDLVTPLTNPIGAADTSFTVDFTFGQSAGLTAGFVEIDSEQLYVTNVNQTNGLCTVANGFGRGFSDTTAASHSAGALIKSQPKFPRIWVFNQLNEVITSLYPQLFAVQQYTTTVKFPSNEYPLPSMPIDILTVEWQDPLSNWRKAPAWHFDSFDGNLRLGSGCMIGRPLRIQYATRPTPFVAETDNFTVTGLPSTCHDVLYLGVVERQLPGLDISRAQASTIEGSDRSRVVPANAGLTSASFIQKKFQDRLRTESQALRRQYRPRLHKVFG